MVRKERMRYWKITAEDTDTFDYDESKLLNWEIKCIREPEVDAHFIGVFMYRNGTAYDYESVKGICYFHNNIDRKELPEITKFLQSKFEGKEMEKGDRIIEGLKRNFLQQGNRKISKRNGSKIQHQSNHIFRV